MIPFEVHITGDQNILQVPNLKTIAINLLKPDQSFLRTEYMTSQVLYASNFDHICRQVTNICLELEKLTLIQRIKIECPFYQQFAEQALYIESHFLTEQGDFPISRNQNKTVLLGTDREYNSAKFDDFRRKWSGKTIELCVLDTYPEEDADWFEFWQKAA